MTARFEAESGSAKDDNDPSIGYDPNGILSSTTPRSTNRTAGATESYQQQQRQSFTSSIGSPARSTASSTAKSQHVNFRSLNMSSRSLLPTPSSSVKFSMRSFRKAPPPGAHPANKVQRPDIMRSQSIRVSISQMDVYNEGHELVRYDDRNHFYILTQMHGSVWPKVFPFCFLLTMMTAVIWHISRENGEIAFEKYTMSSSGHSLMSAVLSFVVVARVTMIYNRSMKSRNYLMQMCLRAHEVVESALLFTSGNRSRRACQWRKSVATRTIQLLRSTVVALEFNGIYDCTTSPNCEEKILQENARNFRATVELAFNLRQEIMGYRLDPKLKDSMFRGAGEYMALITAVNSYMEAFSTLEANTLTPFPFPITQMARTILFFWVSTLPFALCHDDYPVLGVCVLVFVISFGFIGLEYVSMEMTDPFGIDANDFDQNQIAMLVFQDIYALVALFEGDETSFEIMRKMKHLSKQMTY